MNKTITMPIISFGLSLPLTLIIGIIINLFLNLLLGSIFSGTELGQQLFNPENSIIDVVSVTSFILAFIISYSFINTSLNKKIR